MAEPSPKSPAMNLFLDEFARQFHGRSRTEAIKLDVCVICGKDAIDFTDELSETEFTISGMCQSCQDKTFREE